MRCYICDAALSTPNFSTDHDCYDPCEYCLGIIQDAVGSFGDRPAAAEDELGDDYAKPGWELDLSQARLEDDYG